LDRAGKNQPEILKALERAEQPHREPVAFLVANMPERDLETLEADFVLGNVRLALAARRKAPWGQEIPDDIFLNDVLPYATLNEKRENWREDFYERFLPLVRNCKTPGEAAVKLNKEIFKILGVQYHATKRPKPDQSPSESIRAGYASCTGLSILLVDACRAVCVPARIAGTPSWTKKRGNHTWVEVWDGGWHCLGAAESDALDSVWFTGEAANANSHEPMNWIYATSFRETALNFPLVWDMGIDYVGGLNVTDRYKRLPRAEKGKSAE